MHIFAYMYMYINKGIKQNYRTQGNLTKGKSKLIMIETDKISQQPENCENHNNSDLVQAFLKKWSITDTLRLILAYCRHTFLRHRKPYLCSMLCIFPKTYKYECDCGIFYILSYIGLMVCFSLQS